MLSKEEGKNVWLKSMSSGSMVAVHLTRHPKVEGSSLAATTARTWEREKSKKN
jgi:hypothetical protein